MNILVVDDYPFIRDFLGGVLRDVFGDVRLRFANSLEASVQEAAGAPALDMVTLDLGLPDSRGLETLLHLRQAQPEARVVVFSSLEEQAHILSALDAGAAGYVPKSSPLPVIAAAFRLVAAGGRYIPPQALDGASAARAARRDIKLTGRQADVLRLIVRGMANKEIARRLSIAEDTVKQHACAAYAVLGVSNRLQAMHAVTRRGIRLG